MSDLYRGFIFCFIFIFISFQIFKFIRYIIESNRNISDKAAIYEEVCGGRFGLLDFTYPFVRLTIYENYIKINAIKKYTLRIEDITKVKIRNYIFASGIHFTHKDLAIPQGFIIWSRNCSKIKEIIDTKLEELKKL